MSVLTGRRASVLSGPRATRPRPLPAARRRGGVLLGLDWALLGAVAGLVLLGAVLVWTASAQQHGTGYLLRHLVNAAVGAVLLGAAACLRGRWLRAGVAMAYAVALLGLLAVLGPLGSTVNGSRSWITLPAGLSLQPAELAKVGLVGVLALVLAGPAHERPVVPGTARVARALGLAGVPMLLVLRQPDLGTTLVMAATVLALLLAAGASRWWLGALVAAGAAAAMAAVRLGVLADYQVARFAAFADPALDPRGVGWTTAQARVALGNGGLSGQGLFRGSQTSGGFVPEQHTDFVFTAAGEQLGFVGGALLLGLLAVVMWRGLAIAAAAPDAFGRLLAAGIASWFAVQSFENVGMCLGIMPVTGVPLPFVSYGGSSMFAGLAAIGLLQAVHRSAGAPR